MTTCSRAVQLRVLLLLLSMMGLTACGGGGTSSGAVLDLNGTYRSTGINTSGSPIAMRAGNITLKQVGSNVTQVGLVMDPLPGFAVECDTALLSASSMSAHVSGDTLNVTRTGYHSIIRYRYSGTSANLSGTFEGEIYTGICGGNTVKGTVSLVKISG